MNLIEQLGGYEAAKMSYDGALDDEDERLYIRGAGFFSTHEIGLALLAYRREHNIFEVGDKIKYNYAFGSDSYIFEVYDVSNECVHFEREDGGKLIFSCVEGDTLDSIRHATDEEIANNARSK